MDQRPIGVFDSGSGGLTAVREIRSILPFENIIYFGDTSRVPYGGRSAEILLPSCAAAAAATRNKRVGLIATAASVRSGAYERCLAALDGAIQVYVKACPLFVPLVENGRFRPGDPVIETVAREYLEPLRATGIDTLILGCTHYPLLTEIIADIMGPGVTLIDSGAAAARVLRQTLSDRGALAQRDHGTLTLYASDQPEDFGALAGQFLRRPLESAVQHVDIERY